MRPERLLLWVRGCCQGCSVAVSRDCSNQVGGGVTCWEDQGPEDSGLGGPQGTLRVETAVLGLQTRCSQILTDCNPEM